MLNSIVPPASKWSHVNVVMIFILGLSPTPKFEGDRGEEETIEGDQAQSHQEGVCVDRDGVADARFGVGRTTFYTSGLHCRTGVLYGHNGY